MSQFEDRYSIAQPIQVDELPDVEICVRTEDFIDALDDEDISDSEVSHLGVVPAAMHQRTLKQRLNLPRQAPGLSLMDEREFARSLIDSDSSPRLLDRTDRMLMIQRVLETHPALQQQFKQVIRTPQDSLDSDVERARTRIERLTNFHPDRITALQQYAEPQHMIDDLIDVLVQLERLIREWTTRYPSSDALLRAATRRLTATDGSVFADNYPSVESLRLGGLSTVSAALLDLLHVLELTTTVDVEIFGRPASGPVLQEQLQNATVDTQHGQTVINHGEF